MAAGAKLVEHTDSVLTREECDFLIAEIDKLRAENERLKQYISDIGASRLVVQMEGLRERIAYLEALNERHRAALQEIEFHGGPAGNAARAALGKG